AARASFPYESPAGKSTGCRPGCSSKRWAGWTLTYQEPQSFHSGIPNNPEHSRRVLAYDVAIGAGESVDDVTFYAYLCRVADWRLDWKRTDEVITGQDDQAPDQPDEAVETFYLQEQATNRTLIDATIEYRTTGTLPGLVGDTMPSLVGAQTWGEEKLGKPICFGGKA
uniref:effector protein Tle3 domain-containing protein n=1 Tax=Pseudomonas protegens TaxID=380021 RepID=UPI0011874490